MGIIDRWILERFTTNFVILSALLFGFVTTIDIVLEINAYIALGRALDADHPLWGLLVVLGRYHGPRLFQFFQYTAPLVSVASCGFTLAQMHRHRELVALLAAGVSLRRVALPLCVGAALIAALQFANQELVIPRLAVDLLRARGDLVAQQSDTFEIPLWGDAEGNLLHADSFDVGRGALKGVWFMERSPEGDLLRRIRAEGAVWNEAGRSWVLEHGTASAVGSTAGQSESAAALIPVVELRSSLDPRAIMLRRERLYAHMLGLREMRALERLGAISPAEAARMTAGRIGMPLVGFLLLIAALPYFLLREPQPLLGQSVRAAALVLTLFFLSAVLASAPVGPIGPLMSMAAPLAALIVLASWRVAVLRT